MYYEQLEKVWEFSFYVLPTYFIHQLHNSAYQAPKWEKSFFVQGMLQTCRKRQCCPKEFTFQMDEKGKKDQVKWIQELDEELQHREWGEKLVV